MKAKFERENNSSLESLNLIPSANNPSENYEDKNGSDTGNQIDLFQALFLGVKNIFTYFDFFYA